MPINAWSNKDERMYEHIKDSAIERGNDIKTAKTIGAATVNKFRTTRRKRELEFLIEKYTKISRMLNEKMRVTKDDSLILLWNATQLLVLAFQEEKDDAVKSFCESLNGIRAYSHIKEYEKQSNRKFNIPIELRKCQVHLREIKRLSSKNNS